MKLTVISTVLLFAMSVSAGEFYVSQNGEDANAGTKDKPWKSVAVSAGRLKPGDILIIMPRIYKEAIKDVLLALRLA